MWDWHDWENVKSEETANGSRHGATETYRVRDRACAYCSNLDYVV